MRALQPLVSAPLPAVSRLPAGSRSGVPEGSAGQPLEAPTREHMEAAFGQDFSTVRVHADGAAARAAREQAALAYSTGEHLVFSAGRYQPQSPAGRRLLAHELAHTLQRRIGADGRAATAEAEASAAAERVAAGQPAPRIRQAATTGPQCEPDPVLAADTERNTILRVAARKNGNPKLMAWEIVWRMLTRYFPEYSGSIGAVGYEENEKGLRVDIRQYQHQGKTLQSATVTVGKRFVEATSEASLRERITELGAHLSRLQAQPDPGASQGMQKIWKIIHERYPKKGRRLAGTAYDAKLPGITLEFGSGKIKAAGVEHAWSGPRLFYGKLFLDLPEADQEKQIGEQLRKVDAWCLDNGRVVAEDLEDEELRLRIRGLSADALRKLRDAVSDPKVAQYVDSLTNTSTPLEEGLQASAGGGASVVLGNVTVVVRRDVHGAADVAGGSTTFSIPGRPAIPRRWDGRGIITEFTAPPVTITIEVGTRYGSGVDPDRDSAYGRGTVDRDQALGARSLRSHEGAHGLDFVRFVRDNPFPRFGGRVGMTRQQFDRAISDYDAAVADYRRRMEAASEQATDCVGVTIDEHHRRHRLRRPAVCP